MARAFAAAAVVAIACLEMGHAQDVVTALTREVAKLADTMPANTLCAHPADFPTRCLVASLQTNGKLWRATHDPSRIDEVSGGHCMGTIDRPLE